MDNTHKAFTDPEGNLCIVTTDSTLGIKIVGAEETPITQEVAEKAIEQLKESPDLVTIDSDGTIVPIVNDGDSVI